MRYNNNEAANTPEFVERRKTKILGMDNKIDAAIRDRANLEDPSEMEVYKVRWVWYHTILAIEIFTTNILLACLLIVQILK